MANDITTLAIEIQSQEAERNLRTFNELLISSSQTASKMDKVRIEVDVEAALAQLKALKSGYDDLAASAQNVHFDTGSAPGAGAAPAVDTEALNALKEFFASSAEMSKAFREEMEQFNEAISKLEADTMKVASAGGKSSGSMRGAATVSREYAAALRELIAAQKEMETAIAKADTDMRRVTAADADAEAVKKKLIAAQRKLKQTTDALDATHRGYGGNIMALTVKEEALKGKIEELKDAYARAKAEAGKFGLKLDESVAKADTASQKYKEVKARVDAMPKDPMGNASQSTDTFSEKAKLAGTQLTKLARGFNGVAMMAGGAIPGVSGLGRAISMLGMGNPYLAAAALAIGAITAAVRAYDSAMNVRSAAIHDSSTLSGEIVDRFKKEVSEQEHDIERLAELNARENLYDSEKEESREIVEKLTAAYGDLGFQYDALTGKVLNLAEVTSKLTKKQREALLKKSIVQEKTAKMDFDRKLDDARKEFSIWKSALVTSLYSVGTVGISDAYILPKIAELSDKVTNLMEKVKNEKDPSKQQIYFEELRQILIAFQNEHPHISDIFDVDDVSKVTAESQHLLDVYQKISATVKKLQNANGDKRSLDKSIADLKGKLQAAQDASMSDDEKYARNVAKIEALTEKAKELQSRDPMAYDDYGGKVVRVREALLEVETEITNRTRERLRYEKQLEALTAKIEAQKRNWTMDDAGNITGRKGDAEKRAMRNGEIDTIQNEINELRAALDMFGESDPARGHELSKQIAESQLKLNALQQEKIADEERAKRDTELAATARKRVDEARKAYIIDQDGNIVRRKNASELAAALASELATAQQRVEEAKRQAANAQAATQAEAELASLRKKQSELAAARNSRQHTIPEGDVESDPELERMDNELETLEKLIEAAKAKAFEARKKAGATGVEVELANAEADLSRLQEKKFAEQEATDAARKRAEEAKRGLVIDQQCNIVREQTEAEMAKALQDEITAQRDKVTKLVKGTSERYEAEAELTKLLRQQFDEQKRAAEKAKREAEATSDAKKRADDAKKGFVWDAKGNIVRRKNDAELAKEREKEIAAAKAKVAATKAGTKERHEAEAELRRLTAADFAAREQKGGDGTLGMMSEEKKVNSNMVKGVDAKSTEAMALQARNFTRGADPEKKVEASLREIEKLTVQIRDFVTECKKYLDSIATDSNDIASKVSTI